jgi:hypothetical protein
MSDKGANINPDLDVHKPGSPVNVDVPKDVNVDVDATRQKKTCAFHTEMVWEEGDPEELNHQTPTPFIPCEIIDYVAPKDDAEEELLAKSAKK